MKTRGKWYKSKMELICVDFGLKEYTFTRVINKKGKIIIIEIRTIKEKKQITHTKRRKIISDLSKKYNCEIKYY